MSASFLAEVHTAVSADSTVGAQTWIRAGTHIASSMIGKSCFIGFRSQLRHADVADGVMFAARSRLLGTPSQPIQIGANAWIGANATIAPAVSIGAGAVVAAGALVTTDILADAIVVGRPGKVIATRNATEDGSPNPSAILARVRQRAQQNLPSFLDAASLTPERAKLENGVPDWEIFACTMIDAELRGGQFVRIGARCVIIGRSTETGGIAPNGGLHLGEGSTIGNDVVIEAGGGLHVGNGSVISDDVTIVTSTHDYRFRSLPWIAAPVSIGNDCLIGKGAVIVGPVSIGNHAIIEPYSVIVRDVGSREHSRGVISIEG